MGTEKMTNPKKQWPPRVWFDRDNKPQFIVKPRCETTEYLSLAEHVTALTQKDEEIERLKFNVLGMLPEDNATEIARIAKAEAFEEVIREAIKYDFGDGDAFLDWLRKKAGESK